MPDYLTRDQLAEYVGRKVVIDTAAQDGRTLTAKGTLTSVESAFDPPAIYGYMRRADGAKFGRNLTRVTAIRSLDDE